MDSTTRGRVLPSLIAFLSAILEPQALLKLPTPSVIPRVSPKRKLTKGKKQFSQKERANRRKASKRSKHAA